MATDIAFALGVVALLGRRVPAAIKVLLLTLAIVDDIGAIVVIAIFYTDELRWGLLLAALGLIAVIASMHRVQVTSAPALFLLGLALWLVVFESGVHATIAGVALGLLTPARPFLPEVVADRIADELSSDTHVTPAEVRSISFRLRESIPTTERLSDLLHPWTSYLVVPLFALANAGVPLTRDGIADAASSPVTLGVFVGLVVGKAVGVTAAIALAVRLGVGRLPQGVDGRHVLGMATIAGIGFTVSIFVAGLAFDDPALTDQAKIGVLAASVVAAGGGAALLSSRPRREGDGSED
jgi:NhaA family Na+:H+ antiporter